MVLFPRARGAFHISIIRVLPHVISLLSSQLQVLQMPRQSTRIPKNAPVRLARLDNDNDNNNINMQCCQLRPLYNNISVSIHALREEVWAR